MNCGRCEKAQSLDWSRPSALTVSAVGERQRYRRTFRKHPTQDIKFGRRGEQRWPCDAATPINQRRSYYHVIYPCSPTSSPSRLRVSHRGYPVHHTRRSGSSHSKASPSTHPRDQSTNLLWSDRNSARRFRHTATQPDSHKARAVSNSVSGWLTLTEGPAKRFTTGE